VAIDESRTETVAPSRPTPRIDRSKGANRDRHATWWSTGATLFERCAWVALPIVGMLWVASRYNHEWFIVDEWEMIGRATASGSWLHTMFSGYGGHLYALPYLVYRLQVDLVGVEQHWLVYLFFCGSLGALHVSIAVVLYRLGLPSILALLSAGMVTYFGPGSQSMTFEWFAGTLSLALCFFAAFIALRDKIDVRTAVAVAAVLLGAIGTDSSEALLGILFVSTITVLLWPRRFALVALGPPVLVLAVWLITDRSSRYASAPLMKSLTFAHELVTLAAGGLVGRAQVAGWICLAVAIICVSTGLARRAFPRAVVASLTGGTLAAAATLTAAAKTKAGYVTLQGLVGSRYVHHVALFLLLALAPVVAATIRPNRTRTAYVVAGVAAAGLVTVFVLNLNSLWPNRQFFEAWSSDTKASVRRSVTALVTGCNGGEKPNAHAYPVKAEGSDPFRQIPVYHLQSLLRAGALSPDFGIPPTRAVVKAICQPPESGR
jgi:hypothetical protein